jgi:hypothetical protein
MTTKATRNAQDTTSEGTLFVAFELRGYPETKLGKKVNLLDS